MALEELNRAVSRFLEDKGAGHGVPCGLPGLLIYESRAPSPIVSAIVQPLVGLTLQGEKEMHWGARTQRVLPGESVIVSHDLPVNARVVEASNHTPYRSLVMTLDLAILRSLQQQIDSFQQDDDKAQPIVAHHADTAFIDTLARYFALVDEPGSVPVMAPLIQRELHFRSLSAPHGQMLRRLLSVDSHASRIGRAISHIRTNYDAAISVAELSSIAGMSLSSFHAHFRAVTETTPLQYQKELRLIEAQRLMNEERIGVSAAAFRVGYESPTQFSREYSRRFGASPRESLRA